jgi:hypothetical protein
MDCPSSGEAVTPKRKPRKKVRQPWKESIAVEKEQYPWYTILHGYQLKAPNCIASIVCDNNGVWHLLLQLDGKRYSGTRTKLEDAFKAIDHAIALNNKDIWLKCNCSAVLRGFAYSLDNIGD